MITISSTNIKVYPAIGRTATYAESSYINTESNITGLLKALYPKNNCSFVFSDSFSAPFKFVIFGYYFEITDLTGLDNKNLWARIYITDQDIRQKLSNPDADKTSLDVNSVFNGIRFYNQESKATDVVDGMTAYDLKLTDSSGNIPSLSKFYFKTEQIRNIDDNYLTETFNTSSITASYIGTYTASTVNLTASGINASSVTTEKAIVSNGYISTLTTDSLIASSADITNLDLGSASVATLNINKDVTFPKVQIGDVDEFIYINSSGKITATTADIGASYKPVYMTKGKMAPITSIYLDSTNNYINALSANLITTQDLKTTGTITASTSIGNETHPIYVDALGHFQALSGTVGAADKPVWVNAGGLTPVSTISLEGNNYLSNLNSVAITASTINANVIEVKNINVSGKFTNSTSVGSASNPIFINNSGNFESSTENIGSSAKPVYLNKGEITAISNLELTGSSSLGILGSTTLNATNTYYIGDTKDYVICTTDEGKLIASDMTTSEAEAESQQLAPSADPKKIDRFSASFSYIDTLSQESTGKIVMTKKYLTIKNSVTTETYTSSITGSTITVSHNYLAFY